MSSALDLRSREFKVAAACVGISIGLHAAFLLVARVGNFSEASSSAPASSGVQARLTVAEPLVPAPVVSHEPALQPLKPIPQRAARSSRSYPSMLEFRPVDIPPRAFDESPYLPVGKLTRAPSPIVPVNVPYPEGTAVTGTVVARLTLFIDEDGHVVRVVIGSGELPDAFVQAAKDAFEAARFRPGQIDGTPVKVRMVVDVEFEDRGERRPKRGRATPS
jgi:hypothetical protein